MLPVHVFCIYELMQHSNLWPLYAIFTSPAALPITGNVLMIKRRHQRAIGA